MNFSLFILKVEFQNWISENVTILYFQGFFFKLSPKKGFVVVCSPLFSI